jgi:hypothetical protein
MGTGLGLSASVGVQDIIAIGKRIIVRTALTTLWNRPRAHARSWRHTKK